MHRSREFQSFAIRLAALLPLVWSLGLSGGLTFADEPASRTGLYHSDPQHLWNRLHGALFVRIGTDGREYGRDRLEPLLWHGTKHLRNGPSHEQAVALLEEFVSGQGEKLIGDPLKRAILQRDLWLVFNWGGDLQRPLATIISRLALAPDQIKDLPDNYAAAIASGEFAKAYDPEQPDKPYLPADLFAADGPWVCLGRPDGPVALEHVREDLGNSFTNSAFLVFLRLPGGRAATLEFAARLRSFAQDVSDKENAGTMPEFPKGTELALVRRALLIDSSREPVASALTESIQLRVYRGGSQSFNEFRLSRSELFSGRAGGLRPLGRDEQDLKTGFRAHAYDAFEAHQPGEPVPQRRLQAIRENCINCHRSPTIISFNSYFNYRGSNTRDGDTSHPVPLAVVSPADALSTGVKWKQSRPDWGALRALLKN
jgi:hypothetical protein